MNRTEQQPASYNVRTMSFVLIYQGCHYTVSTVWLLVLQLHFVFKAALLLMDDGDVTSAKMKGKKNIRNLFSLF